MFRKVTAVILCAAAMLSLCGCAGIFEKKYVSVTDYNAPEYSAPEGDKVTVRGFVQLKNAILKLVSDRLTSGTIVFDAAYEGDISEDIASACWQLRTQNALCAYSVQNISYELNKIVTYSEAQMSISYSKSPDVLDEIVSMSYSIGIDDIICGALEQGDRQLVLYIQNSSYTAEQMEDLVTQVYRAKPFSCITAPTAAVHMYGGSGLQRLYEINIGYGMNENTLRDSRQELSVAVTKLLGRVVSTVSAQRALELCRLLLDECIYSPQGGNTAYDALVENEANDEGMALAYAGLCEKMGIECTVVYGQRNWTEHCWNIVNIDGSCYHVDVSACVGGIEYGFMRSDESMWNDYRWDTTAYPACAGPMSYYDITE